ncbi:MAG: WYL domain-containing protein, partial [Gammaproteobacteria bacterium]|nr:WYL domain-containing protein [Gammaproteobacteria bacterium]
MNRFERLIKIHRLLQSSRPLSIQRFMEELECARATIFRDFDYLRTFLDAPIVNVRLDDGSHGHHYDPSAERFELPGLWLNASELHALLVAEQLLESVQPGLLTPRLRPLRGRLRKLLGESGYAPDAVAQRVNVRTHAHRALEPDAFGTVAQAVLASSRLQFQYRSRSRNELRERTVHPQRLVHYRSNWYLAGWCEDAEDLRMFSLDRVREPRPIDGT